MVTVFLVLLLLAMIAYKGLDAALEPPRDWWLVCFIVIAYCTIVSAMFVC